MGDVFERQSLENLARASRVAETVAEFRAAVAAGELVALDAGGFWIISEKPQPGQANFLEKRLDRLAEILAGDDLEEPHDRLGTD